MYLAHPVFCPPAYGVALIHLVAHTSGDPLVPDSKLDRHHSPSPHLLLTYRQPNINGRSDEGTEHRLQQPAEDGDGDPAGAGLGAHLGTIKLGAPAAAVDIDSLQKQLQLVDQRLATLTGRLEVLKAVQQVLPAGKAIFVNFFFPEMAKTISKMLDNNYPCSD